MQLDTAGPDGLGPWLVWAARSAFRTAILPSRGIAEDAGAGTALATRVGIEQATRVGIAARQSSGIAAARARVGIAGRIVLDLCAGSGSWSEPYQRAGYDVRRVTLPASDVRLFVPPENVWGVLAAPPCTEFSLARNASAKQREFADALEVVSACVRVVAACRPVWWALENPIGLLSQWLGVPADTWEPYEFGDPWTKPTAIWGEFVKPERGPFVKAKGSAAARSTPAARALTPPGFAQAFFAANP